MGQGISANEWTVMYTNGERDRQRHGQTGREAAERRTDKRTAKQTEGQAELQTADGRKKPTERQTES